MTPSRRYGMSADVVFSLAILRTAEDLVEQARRGELGSRSRDLFQRAKADPKRITSMAMALAYMVAEERPPLETAVEKHLREAHAAYARGLRDDWVVRGEREYQRDKKRRHRRRALWLRKQARAAAVHGPDQARAG